MSEILQSHPESILAEYDRLRDDAVLIDLDYWRLFELTGDDRKAWLQGQVTNDLRRFLPGNSSSFCICSSTGQLQAVVDGWALEDRFALVCQRPDAPALARRIEDMVILENVEIEDVTRNYRLISIQGPGATDHLAGLAGLPSLDAGEVTFFGQTLRVFRADRTGSGGWDLWIPGTGDELLNQLRQRLPSISPGAYEISRLEAGIPKSGIDYTERTLPPELGPSFEAKHISYSKGCYTGQEVLMRIHSRGHTNRSWVGLLSEVPLAIGASVSHRHKSDVGVVTSSALSPDFGPIAAAMVKNEYARLDEELVVESEGGQVAAKVRPMPILASI